MTLLSESPRIEFHNQDCMIAMAGMKDNEYDLAIVDPEFGIGEGNKTSHGSRKGQVKFTQYKKKNWDNKRPSPEYFIELFRVSKNQIIWGANYFTEYLPSSKGWIFWDKNFAEDFSFSDGELAFTSFDVALKKVVVKRSEWMNCVSNNKQLAKVNAKIHPTQKPVKLYTFQLKHFAKKGDKILDTHGGALSIAIACHQMGFDLTVYELDKDYYEDAIKRFKENTAQRSLDLK